MPSGLIGNLDSSARPLLVRNGNAGGLHIPQGTFETGLRCFWRAVIADLMEGKVAPPWPDIARLHTLVRDLAAPQLMRVDWSGPTWPAPTAQFTE